MKNIALHLAFMIYATTLCAFAEGEEINWITDFAEAKELAEKEGKTILMSFSGSDWCSNCMRLDKDLFQTAEFSQYAKSHLVLLKLDFPARKKNKLPAEQLKHNEALAETYNKKGVFPLSLLLDSSGKQLGKMKHPATTADEYLKSIQTIISK